MLEALSSARGAAKVKVAVFLAVVLFGAHARADEFLPGSARAFDHRASSLRDAPVAEMSFSGRARVTLGLEPAVYRLDLSDSALRFGFYGAIAIENVGQRNIFPPNELWRGLVGGTVAWQARPDLELTAVFGHESVHADLRIPGYFPELRRVVQPTGPGIVKIPPEGEVGELVGLDLAGQRRLGDLSLTARLQWHLYFHGLADAQPAAELTGRYVRSWVMPTLSVSGETVVASGVIAPVFRALLGLGLRGRLGELMPFLTYENGYGRGYLLNERAKTFAAGIRLAPF